MKSLLNFYQGLPLSVSEQFGIRWEESSRDWVVDIDGFTICIRYGDILHIDNGVVIHVEGNLNK